MFKVGLNRITKNAKMSRQNHQLVTYKIYFYWVLFFAVSLRVIWGQLHMSEAWSLFHRSVAINNIQGIRTQIVKSNSILREISFFKKFFFFWKFFEKFFFRFKFLFGLIYGEKKFFKKISKKILTQKNWEFFSKPDWLKNTLLKSKNDDIS